jgi:hypothetical protein
MDLFLIGKARRHFGVAANMLLRAPEWMANVAATPANAQETGGESSECSSRKSLAASAAAPDSQSAGQGIMVVTDSRIGHNGNNAPILGQGLHLVRVVDP